MSGAAVFQQISLSSTLCICVRIFVCWSMIQLFVIMRLCWRRDEKEKLIATNAINTLTTSDDETSCLSIYLCYYYFIRFIIDLMMNAFDWRYIILRRRWRRRCCFLYWTDMLLELILFFCLFFFQYQCGNWRLFDTGDDDQMKKKINNGKRTTKKMFKWIVFFFIIIVRQSFKLLFLTVLFWNRFYLISTCKFSCQLHTRASTTRIFTTYK